MSIDLIFGASTLDIRHSFIQVFAPRHYLTYGVYVWRANGGWIASDRGYGISASILE